MAKYYWKGGESSYTTIANRVANWVDDAGANPASADFAAGTDLVFDGRAIDGSSQFYDCDCTGWTLTNKLGIIHITSAYGGNVGSSTNPMLCSASAVIDEGSGISCYKDKNVSGGTGLIILNNSIGALEVYNHSTPGLISLVEVIAGALTLKDDVRFTELAQKGGTVTIGYGCFNTTGPVYGKVEISGGALVSNSPLDLVRQYAGTITIGNGTDTSARSQHVNDLRIHGGIFNWQPKKGTTGGETDPIFKKFVAFGGTINALGTTKRQIGSGSAEISNIHSGGTFDGSDCAGQIVFGTGSKVRTFGDGLLYKPSGTQESW
jgi:hypothetical protein